MSDCPSETGDPMEELAKQPKAVSGDQGSWTNHSLKDQIELDRYNKAKNGNWRSIYAGKFSPPDARNTS